MVSTLTRLKDKFAMSPGDGPLVVRGQVAADGSIAGTLNTQPPGKTPYLVTVTGHITPAAADVTYTTPRCTAHGTFTIRPVTLLP